MYKVIIVVLGAEGQYIPLVQSIRDTWGSYISNDIVYSYGWTSMYPYIPEGSVERFGDNIICGLHDSMQAIHCKTLLTFKYLYENMEFDYIFRCCAGSYIYKPVMTKFLFDKPRTGFYCGIQGRCQGHAYASGSGYFLSRDLVKLTIDHIDDIWVLNHTDDVAMGIFMQNHQIPIFPGALRVDFDNDIDLDKINLNQYHYHFRRKPEFMYKIHECIIEKEIK